MGAREELAAAVRASFELERHEMSEKPKIPEQQVAIVQVPGASQLKAAIWRDGEWRSDRGKPFDPPPVCWFSVELRK